MHLLLTANIKMVFLHQKLSFFSRIDFIFNHHL